MSMRKTWWAIRTSVWIVATRLRAESAAQVDSQAPVDWHRPDWSIETAAWDWRSDFAGSPGSRRSFHSCPWSVDTPAHIPSSPVYILSSLSGQLLRPLDKKILLLIFLKIVWINLKNLLESFCFCRPRKCFTVISSMSAFSSLWLRTGYLNNLILFSLRDKLSSGRFKRNKLSSSMPELIWTYVVIGLVEYEIL